MKNFSFLIVICILVGYICNLPAQAVTLTNDQKIAVAALLDDFDIPNAPGVTLGIFSHGKMIFQESKGYSNLVRKMKIDENSAFDLTGMTPHFVAFAIFLLEDQGALDLDDSITKYLDHIPKSYKDITIQHLLSHSSGLPGYWPIKELMGIRAGEAFTKEMFDRLITQELPLMNIPGQSFSYTGTGPALLMQIISEIKDVPVQEYFKNEIFIPLNMRQSGFTFEESAETISFATAYRNTPHGYQNVENAHAHMGPTGIVSSLHDLMIWFSNIEAPSLGSKKMMAKLDEVVTLDSNEVAEWSRGKLTYGQQFMHDEAGLNKIWDSGALAGNASAVFRFPSENLTFCVLGNNGLTYNGYLGMMAANIVLEDKFEHKQQNDREELIHKPLTESIAENFVGDYYDPESFLFRQIILKNDTLRYFRPNYGSESFLIPLSENRLHMLSALDDIYTIEMHEDAASNYIEIKVNEDVYRYNKFNRVAYDSKQLQSYCGDYFCEKLKTHFSVTIQDGELQAYNHQIGNIKLSAFKADVFIGDKSYFKYAEFLRDSTGEIKSFALSQMEFKDLIFRKFDMN